jgi:hypothetical protein
VSRLYAQRIDASGQLMWSGPVSVSTDTTHASRPQVDADGAGGVVIAWSSFRSVTDDVYAQHIDAGGTRLWGDAGVAVAPSTTFTRFLPGVVSDANGGAVVVWLQFHPAAAGERVTAIRQDLFAQRLDGNGAAQWAADGQQLSLNMHLGSQDTVCTDGAGGAYVVYYGDSLRVQHVTVAGGLPWGPAGLAMTNANVFLWTPMVRSPDGGVIVCWGPYATYPLVAAQSIRPDGQLRWGPQGVMVSTASSVHSYPALAADPYGGATFAWSDTRNGGNFSNADIYAQRVGASGTLGLPAEPPHAIRLALASAPCPARGADPVQLRFALPADGRVRLALYDLSGRLVRVLVDEQKAMGWRTADWDGRDGNGRIAPAGVYLARLTGAVGVADTRIVRLP